MRKLSAVSTRVHVAAGLVLAGSLAGCFQAPEPSPSPDSRTEPTAELTDRVRVALRGHEKHALAYAGLYAVLADRFDAGRYATTTEAAAIAGRAAKILDVPGVLTRVVDDELNPLLGKPQPITPDLAAQAAERFRRLSVACREDAR